MKKTLLSIFIFISFVCFGQSYHVTPITVEDGLSQNEVYDILQDRRGSLWFATQEGITVYNGVDFKYINDENGLESNIVYSLYEDVKGHIWIGTHKGLTVYDGKDFRTYTTDDGLTSNIVKAIFEDVNSRLWIGTQYGGVCLLNNITDNKSDSLFTNQFEEFELPFSKDYAEITVSDIIEGTDETIWFGTNKGLVSFDEGQAKVYTKKDGLLPGNIYDLHQDEDDNILIATSSGLSKYSDGEFINYNRENNYPFDAVLNINEDKLGNIWVGTSRMGVVRVNFKLDIYEVYNSEKGLSEDIVLSILEDASDNIWIGTKGGGVNKFRSIGFTHFNEKQGLPNEKINGLTLDSEDNIWFATRGGAIKYSNDSFTVFNKKSGLPVDYVNTIFEDNDENIWIGGLIGLTKIVDGRIEKVFSIFDGVVNPVTCLYQDKKGVLWVGTEGGLGKIEGDKIKFYRMIDGMNQGKITSITEDNKGRLWIGTLGGGINWFNGIDFGYLTEDDLGSLSSNFVNCIVKGPRGNIFIGTKDGITKYNVTTDEPTIFNAKNSGLSSNNINMMIFDEDNQLWVGTDKGLDRIIFNPPQIIRKNNEHISEIKHYGRADGIIGGEINRNAACEDEVGNIWFGSNKGAIKLDITVDDISNYTPPTYITGIKVENQKQDWRSKNYEVEAWTGLPKNLVLPYYESSVAFEFVGINHEAQEKVEYYWYLEGFEEKRNIPEKTNKASYPKLPPGEYTFKVYACNKDELCGEDNPATFSFVVSPPFWQEGWFVTSSILIGLLLIYLFIKFREKKLMQERELLEDKVKERTQEVVDKNKELELVNLEIGSKNKEIESKNNDLNSSIRYALTIQQASFPPIQELKDEYPDSFMYHLPRDIVSGDFYWYKKLGDKFVIAIADCTGHGVPGALTSMIGIALLNEIVSGKKITDPSIILNLLDKGIIKAFENSESETNDGMDISLITIDQKTNEIEYSGAYRPLILIRNGFLQEFKATKMSIGFKDVQDKTFEKHTLQIEKGDNIYMFSDGYPDQFGGPKNKKFKSKMMKDMLISSSSASMAEQKEVVDKAYLDWKGDCEQVDDILVSGIKF
jgi:ligand-binding sensor domain-containing protein/serine phosphatase RsbU (regulator of sigma subunit)